MWYDNWFEFGFIHSSFKLFYDNVTAIRCIHEEKNEKWKIFLHRSNDMFAIQMAPVDLQANTRVTNWIFRPEERKANKTRFLCYGKVEYSAIKGSWKNSMEQHHNGKNKSFRFRCSRVEETIFNEKKYSRMLTWGELTTSFTRHEYE